MPRRRTMENKLMLGSESRLITKTTKEKFQELWATMPTEDASVEDHREFLQALNEVRQPLAKIVKHLNRQQVIVNTQMTKARMRDHVETQLNIFDFGVNPAKDQGQEAEEE